MDRSTVDHTGRDTRGTNMKRRLRRAAKRRMEHHEHKEGHMGHRHHHHFAEHDRGGRHGGHGRHRARRGAVRQAVLLLLDEQPMHGYELITELEQRSEGRWRPSPGAMYPALSRMEERGLIEFEDVDGKRRFSLTDDGRARAAEFREAQGDDAGAPWDDAGGTGQRGDMRRGVAELVGQVRQIGRFGTPDQIERAGVVLASAKQSLYEILATPPSESDEANGTADSDTSG